MTDLQSLDNVILMNTIEGILQMLSRCIIPTHIFHIAIISVDISNNWNFIVLLYDVFL